MFAAFDKVQVECIDTIKPNSDSIFQLGTRRHEIGPQVRTFTSSIFLKNTTASGQKARTKRSRLILDS